MNPAMLIYIEDDLHWVFFKNDELMEQLANNHNLMKEMMRWSIEEYGVLTMFATAQDANGKSRVRFGLLDEEHAKAFENRWKKAKVINIHEA